MWPAAQSVVAPLGSLTLVANVMMAPWVLKEKVSKRDVYSTLLIVAGCVLAVAFASHSDEGACRFPRCMTRHPLRHLACFCCSLRTDFTTAQLFKLYTRPQFIVYCPLVVAIIIGMLLAIRYVERILTLYGQSSAQYARYERFHRFSYACVSGIAGAQSIMFAKTTVTLIKDSTHGGRFFLARGQSYGIIFAMLLTVTLQIYWLNCGLARWDAVNNVPVFQSFWILVSVVGGGIFYSEFNGFKPIQWVMFPAGILLTVIGVFYLSRREISSRRRASTMGIGDDVTKLLSAGSGTGEV